MTDRKQLRHRLRDQRRTLTETERRHHADALAQHFTRHPLFLRSQAIGMYLPSDGEMDPTPLMQQAWAMGKRVYLPILAPLRGNRLWFSNYRQHDRLVKNRFGIPEPTVVHGRRISLRALDLVLTPLVAFDPEGNRLGMGGGFYDRSFAYLRHCRHWRKPHLVGLAYDFQCIAQLPSESWDIPLQGIATDKVFYNCRT